VLIKLRVDWGIGGIAFACTNWRPQARREALLACVDTTILDCLSRSTTGASRHQGLNLNITANLAAYYYMTAYFLCSSALLSTVKLLDHLICVKEDQSSVFVL
jgi:hypothetical protein